MLAAQCLPTSSQGTDNESKGKSPDNTSVIIRSSYSDTKRKLKEEIVSCILKLQAKFSTVKHQQTTNGVASWQSWKRKSLKNKHQHGSRAKTEKKKGKKITKKHSR